MKKNKLLITLGLLNLVFVGLLVKNYQDVIEPHRLLQEMSEIPIGVIFTTITLNVLLMFFYGCRVAYLMEEPLSVGVAIATVGYAANNFLPLRLGELFRLYFSKKKLKISISLSTTTIFYERMGDLFLIATLGLIALFLGTNNLPLYKPLIILGLICPFFFLSIHITFGKTLQKNKYYAHFMHFIKPFSLKILSKYTLMIWLITLLIFYSFFQICLPHIHFSFLDGICLTVCTSLSLAMSALPSGLGLFEAGLVYYLHHIKGIDETSALALAMMLHALILIPQLLGMVYFLISKPLTTPQKLVKPLEEA